MQLDKPIPNPSGTVIVQSKLRMQSMGWMDGRTGVRLLKMRRRIFKMVEGQTIVLCKEKIGH